MYHIKIFTVMAVFLFGFLLFLEHVEAKPYGLLSRQKRISDQRLAELETLIALSKMKSKYVTLPVNTYKKGLDPAKLGKRKRSIEQLLTILSQDPSSEEHSEEQNIPERNEIDEIIAQEKYEIFKNLLYNKLLRTNFNELPK